MQMFHSSRRLARPCRSAPIACTQHARVVSCHAAQVESIRSREDVARFMLDLEKSLPGMTLSQLANSFSSCVHTYRAASLSQSAMSSTDETTLGIVDYYTNELPDQSWLLTLRAAVAKHLAKHPAVISDAAHMSLESAVAAATATSSPQAPYAVNPSLQLQHQHFMQILAALAALPVMVVQPLPIGFGTPRWYRPLAAADPAAWETWLADVAAVYTSLLQQQHEHLQHQAAQSAADALLQPESYSPLHNSSSNLGSFIAAAAAVGREGWTSAAGAGVPRDPEQFQQYALEQLADFMINLACCMRWSNVNVDDDRLQTQDFKDKVLLCLQQQLAPQPLQQQHMQDAQHQQQHYIRIGSRPPTPEPPGSSSEDDLQWFTEQQDQSADLQHQQHDLALAGSFLHRLTYSMLLLLLPPPRPILSAFFDATADKLPELFSLADLQGLVRGLLFLGAVPSEPWLRALVGVVRGRAQDMEPKEVQGFVEGFRFFGTKARRAGWLRDATAQLEEFTLC